MQIFAGLGNPGSQYAGHRHNIGFMALDRIAEAHGFATWRSKFQAEVSEGRLGSEKVLLLKPQTFMNRSGQAVGEALRFYKLDPDALTVFHDELDLAPGKVRVKVGGGHAGHNGLRSIHSHIGEAYRRVRLGIGHPGDKSRVAGYVLHDFAQADRSWLEAVLDGICDGADALAAADAGRFQNAIALRTAPPRSGGGADRRSRVSNGVLSEPHDASDAQPETGRTNASGAVQASSDHPEEKNAADQRSPLQRLVDRFR